MRDGVFTLTQRGERLSEIKMGFREIRLKLQCFTQMRHRFVPSPLLQEGDAQNVVGCRVVRRLAQHLFALPDGFLKPAL